MVRHGFGRLTVAALVGITAGTGVLLAGCSGGSSSGAAPVQSAQLPGSPTVSPSSSAAGPTASGAVRTPHEVPGYTIKPAPDEASHAFEGLAATSEGRLTDVSTYSVHKDGAELGGLVIFGVDQTAGLVPGKETELAATIVRMLSGSSDLTTIPTGGSGPSIVVGSAAGGSTFAAWSDGTEVTLAVGADRAAVTAFARAYVAAG